MPCWQLINTFLPSSYSGTYNWVPRSIKFSSTSTFSYIEPDIFSPAIPLHGQIHSPFQDLIHQFYLFYSVSPVSLLCVIPPYPLCTSAIFQSLIFLMLQNICCQYCYAVMNYILLRIKLLKSNVCTFFSTNL